MRQAIIASSPRARMASISVRPLPSIAMAATARFSPMTGDASISIQCVVQTDGDLRPIGLRRRGRLGITAEIAAWSAYGRSGATPRRAHQGQTLAIYSRGSTANGPVLRVNAPPNCARRGAIRSTALSVPTRPKASGSGRPYQGRPSGSPRPRDRDASNPFPPCQVALVEDQINTTRSTCRAAPPIPPCWHSL